MTEDPIRDGLNWYAYCGGNPVGFVDPSGMIVTCSSGDKDEVLRMMGEITDDEIDFVEYVDDNGNGIGMGEIRITKSNETERKVGQKLISDLINCETTNVNIKLGLDNDSELIDSPIQEKTNKVSWDDISYMQVYVDNGNKLNIGAEMMDIDTGEIGWTRFDDFMVLGHELIHSWREIEGQYLESTELDGKYRYGNARQEELQTTGLFYSAPGHTNPQSMHGTMSENGLRLEYGKKSGNKEMKLRLSY